MAGRGARTTIGAASVVIRPFRPILSLLEVRLALSEGPKQSLQRSHETLLQSSNRARTDLRDGVSNLIDFPKNDGYGSRRNGGLAILHHQNTIHVTAMAITFRVNPEVVPRCQGHGERHPRMSPPSTPNLGVEEQQVVFETVPVAVIKIDIAKIKGILLKSSQPEESGSILY